MSRPKQHKKNSENKEDILLPVRDEVNLLVVPTTVQTTATVNPQRHGLSSPIMREGFVSDTGFLPAS